MQIVWRRMPIDDMDVVAAVIDTDGVELGIDTCLIPLEQDDDFNAAALVDAVADGDGSAGAMPAARGNADDDDDEDDDAPAQILRHSHAGGAFNLNRLFYRIDT